MYRLRSVCTATQSRILISNTTIQEALNGPYKKEFITTIEQEKQQLKNYGVYNILNKLPEGAKIIDTK
jgi:hypothetical protein